MRQHRIKMKMVDAPVIFTGTVVSITESSDGLIICVEFDGPMGRIELVRVSDRLLGSGMVDREGNPTTSFRLAMSATLWEVIA